MAIDFTVKNWKAMTVKEFLHLFKNYGNQTIYLTVKSTVLLSSYRNSRNTSKVSITVRC